MYGTKLNCPNFVFFCFFFVLEKFVCPSLSELRLTPALKRHTHCAQSSKTIFSKNSHFESCFLNLIVFTFECLLLEVLREVPSCSLRTKSFDGESLKFAGGRLPNRTQRGNIDLIRHFLRLSILKRLSDWRFLCEERHRSERPARHIRTVCSKVPCRSRICSWQANDSLCEALLQKRESERKRESAFLAGAVSRTRTHSKIEIEQFSITSCIKGLSKRSLQCFKSRKRKC